MDRKSLAFAIRAPLIALAVVTIAPAVRSDGAGTANLSGKASAGQSASVPIVIAQGRCFNGHCF